MNFLKKYQYKLFLILSFFIFCASYAFNIFNLVDDSYNKFDRGSEGYVVGRIMISEIDGFFSDGGLPSNYVYYTYQADENGNPVTSELLERVGGDKNRLSELTNNEIQGQMYDDYINNRKLNNDGLRDVYKTQPSMMAHFYSALHLTLPISNVYKLLLFRFINISLTALAFVLIAFWSYRKFGATTGIITFLFLLFTPWFMRFSHNLWWALWSYYIPFITMLYLLDKKKKNPDKISYTKIFVWLVIAMFLKFAFTGAEFISATAVMAVCPIIFYSLEQRVGFKTGMINFVQASLAVIVGILLGFGLLITQIRFYLGTWQAGIDHIVFSFTKRSAFSEFEVNTWQVLKFYLTEDHALLWKFFPYLTFGFGIMALIVFAFCGLLYWKSRNQSGDIASKSNALIWTTIIGISGPLSWIIVFAQHAFIHTPFDFITWYMPFLIYGYMVMGYTCQLWANKKSQVVATNA